jgi:hypothetical protein
VAFWNFGGPTLRFYERVEGVGVFREHKLVRIAYRHFQPVTVFYARGMGP